MAALSASTNPATAAGLLLLLALLVASAGEELQGSAQGPAPAEPLEADGGPVSTAVRRCNTDERWNDQMCRSVCGMFKFHGYEFTAAAVGETDRGTAPRCCCCPGSSNCILM